MERDLIDGAGLGGQSFSHWVHVKTISVQPIRSFNLSDRSPSAFAGPAGRQSPPAAAAAPASLSGRGPPRWRTTFLRRDRRRRPVARGAGFLRRLPPLARARPLD